MVYETEKRRAERQPLTIVEVVLDSCSLTYGNSPCTAPGSAGQECYNTFKTCQDPSNYAKTTKTYRFCSGHKAPVGLNAFPAVTNVSTAPTRIVPGKGLGLRASITVDLADFPHHDRGIDDYVDNRSYDTAIGTFFGKLYARNPYYQGRTLRVKTGYVTDVFDEANNFITKEYVIEKIDRNVNGSVKITAKDPLKLADNDRAQCPAASSGTLDGAITDTATSISLAAGTGSEYGSSGFVRIDDEIIEFGSRTGDVLNSLTHGAYGTTAAAHSDGDPVQLCKEFDAVNVTDIIYDLLVNYADISSSYIDTVAWDSEESKWLSANNLTTLISEPTGVATLLGELAQENLFDLFWNEKTQKIVLKSIFPDDINGEEAEYTDANHLIKDSVQVMENAKDRVSQVWIYYGVRDYAQGFTDLDNFSKLRVTADTTVESTNAYNETRVKKILSRWFDVNATAIAAQSASRLLFRLKHNVTEIKFDMDAKDGNLWTGDHFFINTLYNQTVNGASVGHRMQVVSVSEIEAGTRFKYQATSVLFTGRYAFVAPNSAPDYGSATDAQKAAMAFVASDAAGFTDGEAYKVI